MILTPGAVTLAELEAVWPATGRCELDPSARDGIETAAARVAAAVAGAAPVYGVNTVSASSPASRSPRATPRDCNAT